MTEEKILDAVKFKRELQDNLWKSSKAKNSKEYVDYINKIGSKSQLCRVKKKDF
jgi:hypothetical protein